MVYDSIQFIVIRPRKRARGSRVIDFLTKTMEDVKILEKQR